MPTFLGNPFSGFFKRILQFGHSGNNGTPTATTNIQAGDGVATSVSLSDDVLSVQPVTDNTTGTMLVKNQGGSNILAVDTTNSKILGGASQTALNTQYAYFGNDYSGSSNFNADQHYAIAFNTSPLSTFGDMEMGSSTSSSFNDTNPASTLTITNDAQFFTLCYWYVMDNITIDAVTWLHGADSATGDSTAAHLMAYTVDIANGTTSGDLSSGVVVADGATITNTGHEKIYFQAMTIQSADVDAGKVIMFTFASDTVNSDYSIGATVKYHIR